jgi:hypothetical protein
MPQAMRRPRLNDLDRALLAIWGIIAVPTVLLGWLDGFLLPPLWSGSPLLIDQIYDGMWVLLVYGLPVVVVVRILLGSLR